mgnify:CR=1 FL=1
MSISVPTDIFGQKKLRGMLCLLLRNCSGSLPIPIVLLIDNATPLLYIVMDSLKFLVSRRPTA